MLENTQVDTFLTLSTPDENENLFNIINYYGFANTAEDLGIESNLQQDELTNQRNIYVCTFCQVFSSSKDAIGNHIKKAHNDCLKEGTLPENYVSKLKALKNEAAKVQKKIGRPRKTQKENPSITNENISMPNPVLSPDGLYWCKKCHRRFKKPRQFSMHLCLEKEDEELLEEPIVDNDDSIEFKKNMVEQPMPWSRRKKRKIADQVNKSCLPKSNVNITQNWREDPSYVPLFKDENEKQIFENHLKLIDYTCVDELFEKIDMKLKDCKNKSNLQIPGIHFSCNLCKKVMNSLSHIRMHCLTHTDLKPFSCPKCPYRSNVKGSLYTHMRTHTGNLFCCSQCDFKSTKRSHLLDHEQTHSSIPQTCKLCKNLYKTLKSLIFHVKRYHNNSNGKKYIKSLTSKSLQKIIIECDICNRKFSSHRSFDAHKQQDHQPKISSSQLLIDQSINEVHDEAIKNNATNDSENNYYQNLSTPLLNLRVRVTPLDDQLINYHQTNAKHNIYDESVISETNFKNSLHCNPTETITADQLENQMTSEAIAENAFDDINLIESHIGSSSLQECSVRLQPLDDQLVEMLLRNLLQQKDTQPNPLFENVFEPSTSSNLLSSSNILNDDLSPESTPEKLLPVNNINQFGIAHSSILDECSKTLSLNILDECLRKSNFTDEIIPEPGLQSAEANLSVENHQQSSSYNLSEIELNFANNQLLPVNISEDSQVLRKELLQLEAEPKSEEIKLFEKCQRAPAYVCCVCSSIFICTSTLKDHLAEHVNRSTDTLLRRQVGEFECAELPDGESTLDDVCRILQGADTEKELEELYTSSLDRMWYLPNVSVLLQKDPTLFDSVLDDISSFPINDESGALQLENDIF